MVSDTKVFTAVSVLGISLMILSSFLFLDLAGGIIFLGVVVVLAYVLSQIFVYIRNSYSMPAINLLINRILAIAFVLFATAWAIIKESYSVYEGISLSASALLFILWSYSLFHFARDFSELEQKPLYFSATMFPIYKYNPISNEIQEHYGPTLFWVFGLAVLLLWAILSNT